jgi:hypothetical protein
MSRVNKNLAEWLEQYGLGQDVQTFAENDIDSGTLRDLTDDDLKELGLSLGHREGEAACMGKSSSGLNFCRDYPKAHPPRRLQKR